MMLGSLSFLHSSPPVFSSVNTVNPSFLNFGTVRVRFKPELPFLSVFLEKLSARVQIRTPRPNSPY